jgi:hypothetical protein
VLNGDLEKIFSKIESLESLEIEMEVEDPEIGTVSIHLFTREEFEEGQIGYSVDQEGNSLTGNNVGCQFNCRYMPVAVIIIVGIYKKKEPSALLTII